MKRIITDQKKLVQVIVEESIASALRKYAKKSDINTVVKQEFEKQLKMRLKNYITENEVNKIVREALLVYPTRIELDIRREESERRMDDNMRQYRDQVLTKMDQIVGELAQIREDRLFEKHEKKEFQEQIDDHEKRIKKIEGQSN